MSKRVFVTGIGIISAIGENAFECRESLKKGQTGIKKSSLLESRYVDIFPFGEISISTEDLKIKAGIANEKGISRTEVLAILAVQEALKAANLSDKEISNYDTSLISASTVGGMSLTNQLYKDANIPTESSDYLESYNIGDHTNKLIKRYKIKGLSTTFNTACSSSANAIMFGAKLIKSGRSNRAIVGGSDALAKFTVNGFNALQILSEKPCMPFDINRTGLTLGEGAAYMILESEDVVGNKEVYAEVTGYGNANDAFHPSSISDEAIGVVKSISEALATATITADEIDYINAHGTATINNDIAEQTGIHKLFPKVPPFNSTKPYTGHTLAAAGSIEAIISILCINNQELYPSLNCNSPIPDYGIIPIMEYKNQVVIKNVLSNSFGFGGNCSSLIFSKV